jgi:MFS transporter, DHA2 family, multidrug resistance protein
VAVAIATFLIVLDYSIANVSIPYISGDLGIAVDQGTYVITSFAVGSAIVLPLSGWLTKRIGMVRLMTLSVLGFTALSLVCGMSRDIVTLVIARFFQGALSGPMIPLSQTLIVVMFPPDKKNAALSFWSTVVIVAPIIGPVLGGWLSYDYSWPWIFFINLPFGIFAAITIKVVLKAYETKPQKLPLDWVGLALLAIGVTCLQFLLDKGEQFDWLKSPIIRGCAAASFICFVFLIPWELFHRTPFLELRLLKIKSFAISILFIAVAYAIYFGAVVLIPLWLQTNMNYTSIWAGISVAPLGFMPFFFSTLIGKLVNKIGALIPLGISFILFAISSFATAFLDTDVDIWHIAFTRFLLGFGMLFFIVPLFQLQVRDLPEDKLPSGAGMFHFVRAMMGGVGTSVFTTLWIRRSAFHHSNIVAELFYRKPFIAFKEKLDLLNITGDKKWTFINDIVDTQAAVLAINDTFYLMGWCFLALLPFLLLGRERPGVKRKEKASKNLAVVE